MVFILLFVAVAVSAYFSVILPVNGVNGMATHISLNVCIVFVCEWNVECGG